MSATAQAIEAHRKGAEIYRGSSTCKEKFLQLLEEFSVPACVFQVALVKSAEFEEFGFHRATGFFWLTQKAKTQQKMSKTSTLHYDVQVAAFIEDRHLSKIAGVKGSEIMVKLPLCEIIVGYPTADKVKCVSTAGVYRVKPLADFQKAGAAAAAAI